MQTEHPPLEATAPPARIRRQYHVAHLAMKHSLSRAEARKVLAAAGSSREKADEIALMMLGKRTKRPVDEATHGSGNRNADHGVGSDEQKLPSGIKRRPAPEGEDAFRLPAVHKNGAGGIKRP
jgi:hypothetical protein